MYIFVYDQERNWICTFWTHFQFAYLSKFCDSHFKGLLSKLKEQIKGNLHIVGRVESLF